MGCPGGEGVFVGHRCILTPTKRTDSTALKKVALLWRSRGKGRDDAAGDP